MLFSHLRPRVGERGECRALIPTQVGGAKAAGFWPLFGESAPSNARLPWGVALRVQHRLGAVSRAMAWETDSLTSRRGLLLLRACAERTLKERLPWPDVSHSFDPS